MSQRKELCCKLTGSSAYDSPAENKPQHSAKENKVCGTVTTIGNC
jgi:hypothetical protein